LERTRQTWRAALDKGRRHLNKSRGLEHMRRQACVEVLKYGNRSMANLAESAKEVRTPNQRAKLARRLDKLNARLSDRRTALQKGAGQ